MPEITVSVEQDHPIIDSVDLLCNYADCVVFYARTNERVEPFGASSREVYVTQGHRTAKIVIHGLPENDGTDDPWVLSYEIAKTEIFVTLVRLDGEKLTSGKLEVWRRDAQD